MKIWKNISISVLIIIILSIILVTILFGRKDLSVDQLKKEYAQPPSLFLTVDKMKVHYRDEGPKEDTIPLLLLHGTGSSLHTFDHWVDGLKQKRTIRLDLPGFGLTGPFPDRNYALDHYVEFISEFLQNLNIQKCSIAGNSLGGHIAWKYTIKYPESVDRLILIDAAGYPIVSNSEPIAIKLSRIPILNTILTFITPKFFIRKSIENVYFDKSKVDNKLISRYFELSLREGNRQAFIDRMQSINDTINIKRLKEIKNKTLILWGSEDQLIPINNAYKFQNDLPNDTLVILENTGHVPMEENPLASLSVLKGFLLNR